MVAPLLRPLLVPRPLLLAVLAVLAACRAPPVSLASVELASGFILELGGDAYTTWPNNRSKAGMGAAFPASKDLLDWQFVPNKNPAYGGADTWYPSWAADGNLYSPWTDGAVTDSVTKKRADSHSRGAPPEYGSSTGFATIRGDDPFHLQLTNVSTFGSSTFPYEGRYPCGSLVYNGSWWYGSYFLDDPNATVGGNYVGPSPSPDCGNWCIQGPLVDFRHSTTYGRSWQEPRPNASSATDNLFGESAAHNHKVKFGAPHFVDFGQELEHSPDGKAYIVAHGAQDPESIQAWMQGDEVYMARVEPTDAAMQDRSQWEFYAGGHGHDARWVRGNVSAAAPLVEWKHRMGVVTMTYFSALKKYILSVSTAHQYPLMNEPFDSYFLESDSMTGPFASVSYLTQFGPQAYFLNWPSKFLAKAADLSTKSYDGFLMYSANFHSHVKKDPTWWNPTAKPNSVNPPNSGYAMNLQQSRFVLSDAFAARLAKRSRGPTAAIAVP